MDFEDVIARLHQLENKEKVLFKQKKFGIIGINSLGIYHKDLKILAKEIGLNSPLVIKLFKSDIYEAKILCSKIFDVKDLNNQLMEQWVKKFDTWEICDSFCMGLFAKSEFAVDKINQWIGRNREFEKRAGFAIMAAYCMADKKAENSIYKAFLPLIKKEATDERHYVKKAVNWALRSIGKRNVDLNKEAIILAQELIKTNNKSANWIAKDALKELQGEKVNILDYPRKIYRTNY